jgi:hypothetical protein
MSGGIEREEVGGTGKMGKGKLEILMSKKLERLTLILKNRGKAD